MTYFRAYFSELVQLLHYVQRAIPDALEIWNTDGVRAESCYLVAKDVFLRGHVYHQGCPFLLKERQVNRDGNGVGVRVILVQDIQPDESIVGIRIGKGHFIKDL